MPEFCLATKNFLTAYSNSSYISGISGRPYKCFRGESTIMVAWKGQLLWQVFVREVVNKAVTGLVGGDQNGRLVTAQWCPCPVKKGE